MAAPFISVQTPPGPSVLSYNVNKPETGVDIPQVFKDAMEVRTEVFVGEQGVPAENELDEDDPRSWHWVVYASVSARGRDAEGKRHSQTATVPVGTIRLVPPPHAAHSVHSEDGKEQQEQSEPYIKLGRIATLKPYRGIGLSKLLAKAALDWASEHAEEILPPISAAQREAHGREQKWNGLVMVHAQKSVESFWAKFGFVTDNSLGEWDEEGIMHVGMYKRLTVAEPRHG